MPIASLIVSVYAALVMAGGAFGFVKAKSLPSLIAGEVSGLLLLAAGYGIARPAAWGLPLAYALAFALLVFFTLRYVRSSPRAFMPGGLMSILSLLALIGLALTGRR